MSPRITPFRIDIPQADLDDLQRRLESARWPDELPDAGWDYGVAAAYFASLPAPDLVVADLRAFREQLSHRRAGS